VAVSLAYSKTQVDKAANVWRAWSLADLALIPPEVEEALRIVDHFRACHQYPLTKATMGLRSAVNSVGAPVQVSQRLKRYDSILYKLSREHRIRLSQMQDIGGCRAILPDLATLFALRERLEQRHKRSPRVVDYVTQPKETGYRGIHVIMSYDERLIEVQLRTRAMHEWALAVERGASRIGLDLKSGLGPPEVLDFFVAASDAMAREEMGEVVDDLTVTELTELRDRALVLIEGGGPS
jgi:hypothetical protein